MSYDKLLLGDLSSITDGSTLERIGKINAGIQAFFSNIFFGTGLNNLINFQPKFEDWYEYSDQVAYVNLYPLQIMAESGVSGILGLILFFSSFYFWLKKYLVCTTFATCVFLSNYMQVDLPFTSPLRLFNLILLALVINYPRKIDAN